MSATTITIHLEPALYARLSRLASARGMPLNAYCKEHLARMIPQYSMSDVNIEQKESAA